MWNVFVVLVFLYLAIGLIKDILYIIEFFEKRINKQTNSRKLVE